MLKAAGRNHKPESQKSDAGSTEQGARYILMNSTDFAAPFARAVRRRRLALKQWSMNSNTVMSLFKEKAAARDLL
jgi:hypothetical protein